MRKSGILLPVFSLPDPHGKGCFSAAAYDFIDKLAAAGQSYWQVLPITIAGKGDSPYSPLSCFAGEPRKIDPETLVRKGLISADDTGLGRTAMLRKAFAAFRQGTGSQAFQVFCTDNAVWLDRFALYAALRDKFHRQPWIDWPEEYRTRQADAIEEARVVFAEDILYHKWVQFEFDAEWQALRSYAHGKGIDIIGDIPIYASYESADCWASPHLFKLNAELRPETVSGCPPDDFNADGQIWENPIYDWDAIRADDYNWWVARIRRMFHLYDVVRLDHARGFESFYQIPVSTMRAADGWWTKGPGSDFFEAMDRRLGKCRFIAEDLGYMTPEVEEMILRAGLPNMKIAQFGCESGVDSDHRPENVLERSIIYTGTHDNNTTVGWYETLPAQWMRDNVDSYVRYYLGRSDYTAVDVCDLLIERSMASRARLCIIPMQDYLHLGSEARVNVPGVSEGNWQWQMAGGAFTDELAARILTLTIESGRI